jgi:hypothetical protein
VNRSARDISQQWMEYHVVFATIYHDPAFIACESFHERSRAFHRCEAAADNYDLGPIHFCPASSTVV